MTDTDFTAAEAVLSLEALHSSLSDPALESMNFLNEVSQRYPKAVSFAAGRPHEGSFEVEQVHRYLRRFHAYLRSEQGLSEPEAARALLQYGRTKGIVHEFIARNLAVDEKIHADPDAIVVTVGCQEAILLAVRALHAAPNDVFLAVAPTYVGFTGAARLVGAEVLPVLSGDLGLDFDELIGTVRAARDAGQRPRALYVMPDFANPSGVSMTLDARMRLLDFANEEEILLLEDNPYGLFAAGAERWPTLKCLDRHRRVVYLGSFAKTVLPGARVGFALADQLVVDSAGRSVGLLAEQFSKIKSMISVNTSPIAQAVIAGRLLDCDYNLAAANAPQVAVYRRNRALMLDGLERRLGGADGVNWNAPAGGFFMSATVPFDTGDAMLEYSAQRHGVLWTPMHHFYGDGVPATQMRLSYSQLEPDEIECGLDRLAALIHDRGRPR